MTTVVAAGRRVLPRGYAHFVGQVVIWLGFYFSYLAVRGVADRDPTKAFVNGLNVIDFERLKLAPPEIHHDLPAGGRRLLQKAEGYRYTDRNNQTQEHTNWHSLVFYGELADIASAFDKGDNIFVEGTLQTRQFTPKDGSQRTVIAFAEPAANTAAGAAGVVTRPPLPPVNATLVRVAVLTVVFPLFTNRPT